MSGAVHVSRSGYVTQDGRTLAIIAKVGRAWHYQPKQAGGFGPASAGFRTRSEAVRDLLARRRLAEPRPGTVVNAASQPTSAALPGDYPLYATCAHCCRTIRAADGSAEWVHTSDYRPMCNGAPI